ncbi:MAG: glycoside hydrolase family 2 protein [Phycisphaerae bacterium]|jgi:beta-mannosidase
MNRLIELSGLSWRLTGSRHPAASVDRPGPDSVGPIEASLPGCVHVALLREGLIGDPRIGTNELGQQWVGETNWTYRAELPVPSTELGPRARLLLDGLDTSAEVLVNGQSVGRFDSQHVTWRADIGHCLGPGTNVLEVRFDAPLARIRERERTHGARPVNGDWDPFIFLRKSACNFGWDWGPKVATCGIWGSIRLEIGDSPAIRSVRPLIRDRGRDTWEVDVVADIDWHGHAPEGWRLLASLDGGAESASCCTVPFASPPKGASGLGESRVTLVVTGPALWWPARHGPAPLYRLEVRLVDEHEQVVAAWNGQVGFRTVTLDTQPDAIGRPFTVIVNGRPVFCIGVNWIPPCLLPGLADQPSPLSLLERCEQAAFNMIRVWGGGMYETHEFHDWCDRHGVLVWHDFMFSCAMYPEEEPFASLVELEAREQVSRLSSHASLALWCGGNECIWGHDNWGWKQRLEPGRTWGRGFYLDLLPRVASELDPTRPYWANSPWSGAEGVAPNDALHGDRHTWDATLDGYRTIPSRFCSEFGHQSPSDLRTLASAIDPAELRIWSPSLEHRQRGPGGNAQQYDAVLPAWFAPATSFEAWHHQAQVLQARAMRINIECCRAAAPTCMGALIWQLNDVWPGLTWSLIDSAGRPKLAYAASLRAARPRHVALLPAPGSDAEAVALNDTDAPWPVELIVERRRLSGEVLAAATATLAAPARGRAKLASIASMVGSPADPTTECLVARWEGETAVHLFARDKDCDLPHPEATLMLTNDGWSLVARSLLIDLAPHDRRVAPASGAGWPLTLLSGDAVPLRGPTPGPFDPSHWGCTHWGRAT